MRENIIKEMEIYLFANDIALMIPEIYFATVIMILLVVGVWYDRNVISLGKRPAVMITYLAMIGVLGTLYLYINQRGIEVLLLSGQVRKDILTYYIVVLVLLGLLAILGMSIGYFKKDVLEGFEYTILILLAAFGLCILTSANDFLVVYLGLELQSLCLYVLATYKQHSKFSTEAGLKYFVLGALSSCIILFGISLFYGFTGLLNFEDIGLYFAVTTLTGTESFAVFVSVILILTGLLFKIGAVPFHMWLPDVYSGSPLISTSFFAIVPKSVIFGLLIKIAILVYSFGTYELNNIFIGAAISSIVVGSLGALYQVTLKRLIAYSAIGHTGFMLLGYVSGGMSGVFGILLYIVIYMILSINMFAIATSVRKQSDYKIVSLLGSYSGLLNANAGLAISLCLLLFSIAGIPPLVGFYSKLYIFFSLVKEEYYILGLFAILLSVIGTVYYLRLIRIMFFNKKKVLSFIFPVEKETAYIIVLTSLVGVLFCLGSPWLIGLIHEVVLKLYY